MACAFLSQSNSLAPKGNLEGMWSLRKIHTNWYICKAEVQYPWLTVNLLTPLSATCYNIRYTRPASLFRCKSDRGTGVQMVQTHLTMQSSPASPTLKRNFNISILDSWRDRPQTFSESLSSPICLLKKISSVSNHSIQGLARSTKGGFQNCSWKICSQDLAEARGGSDFRVSWNAGHLAWWNESGSGSVEPTPIVLCEGNSVPLQCNGERQLIELRCLPSFWESTRASTRSTLRTIIKLSLLLMRQGLPMSLPKPRVWALHPNSSMDLYCIIDRDTELLYASVQPSVERDSFVFLSESDAGVTLE